MTTRLSPRQERTLTTDLPHEQILQTAAAALVALGAPDVQVDHVRGCVTGTTRAHGLAWGEHVTIHLESGDAHASTVVIRTDPWMKATLVDWGEANHTIDAIATAFDRAAATRPAPTGAPDAPPSAAGILAGTPDVDPPVPSPPRRPIWEASGDRAEPPDAGQPARRHDAGANRRRRGWYLTAGALAVFCLIGAAVVMQVGGARFEERVDVMQRVPIPGQRVLYAGEPTEFTIFYEVPGAAPEDVVAPPLTIHVVRQDGQLAQLDQPWLDQTYALPGHSGRAVATFAADAAGEYLLMVHGRAPSDAMLAIGESPFGPLLWAGLLVFVAVVALALLVLVALLRGRAARRRASASLGQPPLQP
jgi:hypothetical protein